MAPARDAPARATEPLHGFSAGRFSPLRLVCRCLPQGRQSADPRSTSAASLLCRVKWSCAPGIRRIGCGSERRHVGDGDHDDASAISATISAAITNGWPVPFPTGASKVASKIVLDYAGQASKGLRLISEGAVIDGETISSGPVLQNRMRRRLDTSPTGCFYFKQEGTLFINGNTPDYVVVVRQTRFFGRS